MRPKAWSESAFPCIRGVAWFKYRITKTIDIKITGGRLPILISDRLLLMEAKKMGQIKRGEIYYANLCPVVGFGAKAVSARRYLAKR